MDIAVTAVGAQLPNYGLDEIKRISWLPQPLTFDSLQIQQEESTDDNATITVRAKLSDREAVHSRKPGFFLLDVLAHLVGVYFAGRGIEGSLQVLGAISAETGSATSFQECPEYEVTFREPKFKDTCSPHVWHLSADGYAWWGKTLIRARNMHIWIEVEM